MEKLVPGIDKNYHAYDWNELNTLNVYNPFSRKAIREIANIHPKLHYNDQNITEKCFANADLY